MSRHLSAEEIDQLIAGAGRPDLRAHLEDCEFCRHQLLAAREPLDRFAEAVTRWAKTEERNTALHSRSLRGQRLEFIFAPGLSIAFLILAAALMFHGRTRVERPSQPNQATSDSALLNQVQADISRPAPLRLLPLLVSGASPGSIGAMEDSRDVR